MTFHTKAAIIEKAGICEKAGPSKHSSRSEASTLLASQACASALKAQPPYGAAHRPTWHQCPKDCTEAARRLTQQKKHTHTKECVIA